MLLPRCSAAVSWQLVHPGSCARLPLVRVQKGPKGGVGLHAVHPRMALEVQQVLPQGQELTLQCGDRSGVTWLMFRSACGDLAMLVPLRPLLQVAAVCTLFWDKQLHHGHSAHCSN